MSCFSRLVVSHAQNFKEAPFRRCKPIQSVTTNRSLSQYSHLSTHRLSSPSQCILVTMANPTVTATMTSIDLLNDCARYLTFNLYLSLHLILSSFPHAQDDHEIYQSKINSYY